jgi:hypothetical protein
MKITLDVPVQDIVALYNLLAFTSTVEVQNKIKENSLTPGENEMPLRQMSASLQHGYKFDTFAMYQQIQRQLNDACVTKEVHYIDGQEVK